MPEQTIAELLAPETLARIDNYTLLARVAVEGFISGLHRSLYQGFGSEFFQYRSYVPGDDLKYIDWKVYGKRDRFYTKVFQEETNMNCCLILDSSASMDYGGQRAACTKFRYACMVAACLAYLASRQGDNVGLYAYSDGLLTAVPPGHRTGGLQRILTELQRLEPRGVAAHADTLSKLAENFRRRGLVVWLSDFVDIDEELPQLLKRFRFAHHDCIALQCLDPDEIDLPFSRTTRFVDSESAHEIVTSPELIRQIYSQSVGAWLDDIRLGCLQEHVDFLQMSTMDSLGNILAAYLHRREAMS